jgi:hypothetical protein
MAKTVTGEEASCAQISPGDADIGGGPAHNAGDRRVVLADTTRPGPALVTSAAPWEGSAGAAPGRLRWRTRHERPWWRRRSQGRTGQPRWRRHKWPRLGRARRWIWVLVTSASHGNRCQAGGLRGSGASLHVHGPSGARSSSPDELGWPRRLWTSRLHGVGRIRVNGGGAFQNGGDDDSDGRDRRGASRGTLARRGC